MLFKPVDIASLAFFRVVFGILGFADLMGVWTYYHLYKGYFNPDNFQFKYMGFEWVGPLPEPFMSAVFIGLMVVALLIAVGRWYRVCTVVFFLGFSYVFLLEKAVYLNHGYLFIWLSFLMIFLPANRHFSWDALLNPKLRSEKIEAWSLWILPLMMGIVYFFGAVAKMNADWLFDANPLHDWLRVKDDMPLLGWLWAQKETAYVMAWSGMLLDLTAPFLLLLRKTRGWALGFLLFFHLTNTLIFQIGIFPWLSIALSLLFFPPDWPRQVWAFAKQKMKWPRRVEGWWDGKVGKNGDVGETTNLSSVAQPAYTKLGVKVALTLLVSFHLVMPLRHWVIPGDVAWTEEGHRYAWRMMLRSKRGYGHFEVKNLQTGGATKVSVSDYLTDRQREKIFSHPDMVLQFAHYLRDLWHRRGVPDVAVHAIVRATLNGRKTQPYIDAKVDLAKVEWEAFEASPWILPMEE
ncbi:MAG: HTTM domain-containing protein [Saprospiraceae bacterium]|nr:HTTM domain-containing protein [Saprospiraceae bacterium]MCF8249061.1 HTTM domain-containing protein [Saprospiraceae bacterium]MCF8311083.1 HTTM domain-containing protein [Saprospiraceae bacterium]MCF8440173.1 HTTM domain-containing protein [Saprospiraceae bacterium]